MRHAILLAAALAAFVSTASASEPTLPDADAFARMLQDRLDRDFGRRLLTVASVDDMQAHARTVEGEPPERIVVFYDAELQLRRNHQLARWDSLNVGSLLWLLGAQPDGIRGVATTGNRKGDVLQVSGSVVFARRGDSWIPVPNAARIPAGPEALEQDVSYRGQQLQRLARLGEMIDDAEDDTEAQHLQRALDELLADVESRVALQRGLLRLATGVFTGEYSALGEGLAALMNRQEEQISTIRTRGSSANCRLVRDERVDAAFAQNDIAYMAHRGVGQFDGEEPMAQLRALCAVYPEAIQLVVGASSDIDSVTDLRGRRVDLGPKASGTRVNAEQVMDSAGIDPDEITLVQGKQVGEALDDLVAGEVDAVFVTGVYPFPEIAAHAARVPLRIVSLDEALVAQLWQDAPFMIPITIPAQSYPGQRDAVRTAGVTALLIASEDLPDEDVRQLLDALLGQGDTLARHSAQAYFISRDTADRGISIPLHPAARAYLGGE